jgi:hypothetical protein
MCDKCKQLKQDRAAISARLHAEWSAATSRLLMQEFQAACQRVQDHLESCKECQEYIRAQMVKQ